MNYLWTKFTIILPLEKIRKKRRKRYKMRTTVVCTLNHNKAIKVKGPLGPNVNETIYVVCTYILISSIWN